MTAAAHLASGMDILRISLHILGVAVWVGVGGQIVLAGLVPVLRDAGEGVPQKAARAFARLSWPAFVLVVITGFWNYGLEFKTGATYGWQMVFGVKFLAVIAAGVGAYLHSKAQTPARRGATAGIGLLASLVALVLGVALAG